ncbi:MAG: 4Fe-4S dicluster domain-containing protein [Hyphomicrobiales bacterium]
MPFGDEPIPSHDVSGILSLPVFEDVDEDAFPDDLPLGDIIANEGRIVRYDRGDVIFSQGDYGGSVFLILRGSVRGLMMSSDEHAALRFQKRETMTWFQAVSQLWRNSEVPEARNLAALQRSRAHSWPPSRAHQQQIDSTPGQSEPVSIRVDDFERHTFYMGRDEMFGVSAALTRSARSHTMIAGEDNTFLLELRWPGVRDLRMWSDVFRGHTDLLYSERGLQDALLEVPLFAEFDGEMLKIIAERSTFETHGSFDWTHPYQRTIAEDDGGTLIIEQEPVICEQDHTPDGILLVRSGFARVSERCGHGEKTAGFLGKNDVFGLTEIVEAERDEVPAGNRYGLRAIGYVDLIRIPYEVVVEHVLPSLPDTAVPGESKARWFRPMAKAGDALPVVANANGLPQSMFDFLVDTRLMNGTKAMAINTDRCVNCDDCVRACAAAHDNNPRFVRDGTTHQNLMVAHACMHCADAVCLIDCPTGAIHRDDDTGNVIIDDATCVGCAACASACPYDNIRMAEIRDAGGAFLTDENGVQIVKATKCDFCAGQLGGPACQRACPHDALVRIDIQDTGSLSSWLNAAS